MLGFGQVLQPLLCSCFAPTLKAESGFQLSSLSGSLLLPDTPLRNLKAVAVKVTAKAYDRVMKAYQEFAEV